MRSTPSLFLFAVACSGGTSPDDTGGVPACGDLAITDGHGDVDPCDLDACTACFDACDEPCAVLESYPPQYSCEGVGSWSVYDTCPDWELSHGGLCEDAPTSVGPADVTALGFSADDALVLLAGPFDAPAEWVAEEGRPATVVRIAVAAAGSPVFHDLSPGSGTGSYEASPPCDDYLEIPVTISLTTDDGAFAETLVSSAFVTDLASLSIGAELDWTTLDGGFAFVTLDPSEWDEVTLSFGTTVTPELAGEVSVSAQRDLGGGMGEGLVGPLLRWPVR